MQEVQYCYFPSVIAIIKIIYRMRLRCQQTIAIAYTQEKKEHLKTNNH